MSTPAKKPASAAKPTPQPPKVESREATIVELLLALEETLTGSVPPDKQCLITELYVKLRKGAS